MVANKGYDIQVVDNLNNVDTPILYIDIIVFFLAADFVRLFKNEWLEEIEGIIKTGSDKRGVVHKRRLNCITRLKGRGEIPYIILNNYILLENCIYIIAVGTIDN